MKNVLSALVIALMSAPEASVADILTVIIDPSALPYEISPSKYENSPSKYENSPSNYANRVGGGRNLVTEDNKALGYYVFGEGGIINFYNYNSRRVAYLPAGGHTQSVFTDGDWCGTIGEIRGELVLGISQSCYYAFLLQN